VPQTGLAHINEAFHIAREKTEQLRLTALLGIWQALPMSTYMSLLFGLTTFQVVLRRLRRASQLTSSRVSFIIIIIMYDWQPWHLDVLRRSKAFSVSEDALARRCEMFRVRRDDVSASIEIRVSGRFR
jgi:hypothetical protein